MVRKTVFTREDIIHAGFDLVDKQGLEQLTARNLAMEIGSSTAPVYSNFSNMDELQRALVEDAIRRLLERTRSGKSGNGFLDMGLAVLDFAWDHPRWYSALFLGKTHQPEPGFQIMEELLEVMGGLPDLADLDDVERLIVLKKMALFTHGLATDICVDHDGHHSREEWTMLLDEVGNTILQDAL